MGCGEAKEAVYFVNTGSEERNKWEAVDYPIGKFEIEDEPDG